MFFWAFVPNDFASIVPNRKGQLIHIRYMVRMGICGSALPTPISTLAAETKPNLSVKIHQLSA